MLRRWGWEGQWRGGVGKTMWQETSAQWGKAPWLNLSFFTRLKKQSEKVSFLSPMSHNVWEPPYKTPSVFRHCRIELKSAQTILVSVLTPPQAGNKGGAFQESQKVKSSFSILVFLVPGVLSVSKGSDNIQWRRKLTFLRNRHDTQKFLKKYLWVWKVWELSIFLPQQSTKKKRLLY